MNDKLFSTQHWDIILAESQAYFGRLVIVLRADKGALGDISQEEQLDFFQIVKALEKLFREEFNATMFNYSCLMNNAYRDGERPRVHWHFRPRYKEPISVLGEIIADPNFGYHYISEAFHLHDPVSPRARALVAKKVTEILSKI